MSSVLAPGKQVVQLAWSPLELEVAEPLNRNGNYYTPAFTRPMRGFGISNDSNSDLTFFIGSPVSPSASGLPTGSGDWEQGTIRSTTGDEEDRPDRIRTSGFYAITGPRTLMWDPEFEAIVSEYDSGGNWLDIVGGGWLTSPATIVPRPGVAQMRLVMRRADGANLTPAAGDVLDFQGASARGVRVKPGEVFEGRFPAFRSFAVQAVGEWRAYGLAIPEVQS